MTFLYLFQGYQKGKKKNWSGGIFFSISIAFNTHFAQNAEKIQEHRKLIVYSQSL